jgi:hypothetical protein
MSCAQNNLILQESEQSSFDDLVITNELSLCSFSHSQIHENVTEYTFITFSDS